MSKLSEYFNALPDTIDFNNHPSLGIEDRDFIDELIEIFDVFDYEALNIFSLENRNDLFQTLKTQWEAKKYPMSPLHYAATTGRLDAVKALKNLGFDSHTTDELGCTPLHYAAYSGNRELIALLIEQHGLDIQALDKAGAGLLDWAKKGGHTEAIALCEDIDRLKTMHNKYLSARTAITSAIPDTVASPDVKQLITEYALPSDSEVMIRRLQEKLAKLKKQEEAALANYNFRLICLSIFAGIGGITLGLGILVLILIPELSVYLLLQVLCDVLIITANFLVSKNAIGKKYPTEELTVTEAESDFAPWSLPPLIHKLSLNNAKIQVGANKRLKTNEFMYLGLGSLCTLVAGIVMLIVALLAPLLIPGLLPLAITTLATGTIRAGLSIFGFYKAKKQDAQFAEMSKEIAAIPSY